MSISNPVTTKYGMANKALADVSTAARACDSWLHAWMKGLTGTVTSGFTAGTGGAPPSSSFWTVDRSCNGTTAGAGDNFSNTFTAGEWVSNTAGSAHSWFVLKSPASPGILDGPWYLLVSKDSATATTYTVAISKTAWTGGTTTANPTNAGTVSTQTSALFNSSSTTAGKTHFYTDAKGNFCVMCSRDGTGVIETLILFTELEQTQPSGDAHRAIVYMAHATGGIYASISSGGNLLGASILGFQRDGTAQASSQLIITSHNISGLTELNGINSDVEGIKWGMVISTKPSNMCVRGFVPDMYQISTAPVNGANYPDTINPIWSAIGSTSTGGKILIPLPNVLSL